MTDNQIMNAIIQSYRGGSFVYINPPLTNDSLVGKRFVRLFGPINVAENQNGETLFGYNNETERLRVIQFITKQVKDPKKDKKKHQTSTLTEARRKEIERSIITAYRSGSQFIVALPPASSTADAAEMIRPFGTPRSGRTDDGRQKLEVDDFANQIKAIVTIGYPN